MRSAPDITSSQIGIVLLTALLAASSLLGCGSYTSFASRADLAGAAPIERLLVFADVGTLGFTDEMYEGFRTGMTHALKRCGVESRIVGLDFRDLEEARNFPASKELQPNAVLAFRPAGGTIFVKRMYGVEVSRRVGELDYEIRLFDLQSEKETWQAQASVRLNSYGVSSGQEFASSAVTRLRIDGVLKGCPPEDFARPGTNDPASPYGPYGPPVR